jgi:hypothetical protein
MNRCASPDHPHCTSWVMPGETLCAHGHAQMHRQEGQAQAEAQARAGQAVTAERPYLHVSGFDPRAAGGRQAVKLELRGMPPEAPAELALVLRSDLLAGDGDGAAASAAPAALAFRRGLRGEWRPVFIEFSSRGREHGQYRIDIELHAAGNAPRSWAATLLLLVPRPDASLADIHRAFLSTHKNVRIHADDAGIARVHGLATLAASGPLDIDIQARNASIAQLDFGAEAGGGGRIGMALPTLAWDEELIEIDLPSAAPFAPSPAHACPASSACLTVPVPDAAWPRRLRLYALDACVLGRYEADGAHAADLALRHHGEHGPDAGGPTRRLSARHAVIRAGRHGFEIEDVSRYGVLLDGVWPGRHKPVPLRLGMRIELTASFRGVATLVVTALFDHAVMLHRVDASGAVEGFMLLAPGRAPAPSGTADGPTADGAARVPATLPRAAALPLLFHRGGGFWHLDRASGRETPLAPESVLEGVADLPGGVRYSAGAYPEDAQGGVSAGSGRRTRAPYPPAGRLAGQGR